MEELEERAAASLRAEWEEGLRITTIPQVLARLGLPDDEETRWRIAERMGAAWRRRLGVRGLWRGLRWLRPRSWRGRPGSSLFRLPSLVAEARRWNPAVFILSNDEKLIARNILRTGRVPPPEEIAAVLGLTPVDVRTGLRLLARLAFLAGREGDYQLGPGYTRFLEGLGFNFHTVTLEGGEQFNVP